MDSGLWRQYETEYCTKATELSNRVEGLAALSPGGCMRCARPGEGPACQGGMI